MSHWALRCILICEQASSARVLVRLLVVFLFALSSLLNHGFEHIWGFLVQLLLNQFLFFEPLNGLKLFDHLVTCFASQVGILEVFHGGLVRVSRTESRTDFALLEHASVALVVTIGVRRRHAAHLDTSFVRSFTVSAFLFLLTQRDLALCHSLLKLQLFNALAHVIVDDSRGGGDHKSQTKSSPKPATQRVTCVFVCRCRYLLESPGIFKCKLWTNRVIRVLLCLQ